ncbi:MAG: alcohol dehydrogenase catalytic domain-containing protein [Bacteroidales bacterium]|jgi:L-iditol 2-dehydrogenase|nr:alcohol dehydrogenase catalytic domain-containing protein [Bacteroidales bacterium]
MKSMQLTGIRQMKMLDVPKPDIQNDTDVLIRMQAVGVCGSDVHYYVTGKIGSQVVQYPFPVGHEGAGIVEKVGSEVSSLRVGDRIAIEPAMPCGTCDQCLAGRPHTCRKLRFLGCPGQAEGCLSEYIVMPQGSCLPIPASMILEQASISEPLAIGLYAAHLAGELKGKNIAILGSGPIGLSVLAGVRLAGAANVHVTDKIDERLAIARKSGATDTYNILRQDVVMKMKKREPLMLDVVFECCGRQEALDQAINLLKPGGKLLIVGIPEFSRFSFPVDDLRRKEICIQNVRRQNGCDKEAIRVIADGSVAVDHWITHRFDFEDCKEAFDLVAGYQDGVMKAMINIQ